MSLPFTLRLFLRKQYNTIVLNKDQRDFIEFWKDVLKKEAFQNNSHNMEQQKTNLITRLKRVT